MVLGLTVTRGKYHDNIILRKLKPFEMGLQIPHCFHPEMQEEGTVRQDTEVSWAAVPRTGCATELQAIGIPIGHKGHRVQDHVHMLISIPPKYSVAEVVGYLKGKSAISVARQFSGRQRNFNGENLWARGYAASTVGFEESKLRAYIKNQEQLDSQGYDEKGNF